MRKQTLKRSFYWGLVCVCLSLILMPRFSYSVTVEKGKLYFIGVGPAGPELATLQAIDVIKKVDVIFAPNFIKEAFKTYLDGKEVHVAWPDSVYKVGNKPYTALDYQQELKALGKAIWEHTESLVGQFRKNMAEGKSVGLLVNGDPCLYSDLRWFKKYLKNEEFEVIPGMSSLNAGTALFKADLTQPQGLETVIIHSPMMDQMSITSPIPKLAEHHATMVFFMAGNLEYIVKQLRKGYAEDTPIALAYFIGYPDRQKVIKGTLKTILKDTESENEKEMVLIYVGDFMK